jgi:hypothetical protein
LVRLLALAAFAAGCLFNVAAATAAPPTPVLTGTDPASPGVSLTPAVQGSSSGGIITSSFPGLSPGVRTSAFTSNTGESRTILLYSGVSCEGALLAEGSPQELDTTGIRVTVEPESTTYISAEQEGEGEGASKCSNAIAYKQVRELPKEEEHPNEEHPKEEASGGAGSPSGVPAAPPEPPHLKTIPGGWANDTSPIVTGTAPGAGTVKIFDAVGCTGNPVAKVSAAAFAAGVTVSAVPNAVTTFTGTSVGPGGESGCSQPAYFGEDSIAPHTRITMGPASKTRRHVAVFRFTDTTGTAPGTNFYCRVNKQKWKQCKSPMRMRHLRRRAYVFRVKAVDLAGNTDARPAKRRFKVVGGS